MAYGFESSGLRINLLLFVENVDFCVAHRFSVCGFGMSDRLLGGF